MHLQFLSKHETMHMQMPHLNFPSFPSHNKLTHCTAFVHPTLVNRSCVSNASPKRSKKVLMFNHVQSPFFCGSFPAPKTHCYFFNQLYTTLSIGYSYLAHFVGVWRFPKMGVFQNHGFQYVSKLKWPNDLYDLW